MPEFAYTDLLPQGEDTTPYRLVTAEGVSTPGIFGVPLNGKGIVAQITDTDGGQYDGDTS